MVAAIASPQSAASAESALYHAYVAVASVGVVVAVSVSPIVFMPSIATAVIGSVAAATSTVVVTEPVKPNLFAVASTVYLPAAVGVYAAVSARAVPVASAPAYHL